MKLESKFTLHTYSYLALRQAVGCIGVALPFVLMLGAIIIFNEEKIIQKSISHYYYTGMRDVFVGALCAVALFMFFYTGYDKRDDWAGHAAGIFALGIAWFPTTECGAINLVGMLHFVCAAFFFITLSFFSIYLFTKSEKGVELSPEKEAEKKTRNGIYITCGIIMLVCIFAIAIFKNFLQEANSESFFVFVAETIALLAFGISWLTKGKAEQQFKVFYKKIFA